MTTTYTAEELREFDLLTSEQSSQHQLVRIKARMAVKAFIAEHGREKCDAMFAELQKRDREK